MLPWHESTAVVERATFIRAWQLREMSFRSLCAKFGVEPKTGYKWRNRFLEHGWDGLGDLSRAPQRQARQTPQAIVDLVVAAKLARWTWGPKKLVPWLKTRHPDVEIPAPSTIGEILRRHGFVQRRKRIRRVEPWTRPFEHARDPNDVWSIDFKGWFRTGNGRRCDPLTLSDARTRFLLSCRHVERTSGPEVDRIVDRAFHEFGLPKAIRSDNGPPFATKSLGGLSRLAIKWIKLGIVPERIEPGAPQQNGRHERMHGALKAATAKPARSSLNAQQRAFDEFRRQYNDERPHEALGFSTPASHYRPSSRQVPDKLPEPAYEDGVEVRRVRSNGEIKWRNTKIFISSVLIGEPIGLEPDDDRFHWIRFGPLRIGRVDNLACTVVRSPVEVLPM